MTFEQSTKDYLLVLKNQGVILNANIYGVSEEFKFSNCVADFLENNSVVQKSICVYDDNGTITWKNLVPLNQN
jgi:hypothetical protein